MYPRFLITLDEELNPLPVSVRVGKAVDVVGQAGKPRTISGFQVSLFIYFSSSTLVSDF